MIRTLVSHLLFGISGLSALVLGVWASTMFFQPIASQEGLEQVSNPASVVEVPNGSRELNNEPPTESKTVEPLPSQTGSEVSTDSAQEQTPAINQGQTGSEPPPQSTLPFPEDSTGTEPLPSQEPPGDVSQARRNQIRTEVQSFMEPFIYDPKGRRDPFRPYSEYRPDEGEISGPVLPLQRFDLDQLKLIGIIWDVSDPKAMFLDPNSKVHVVGKEERVGRNNGYVATIREGEVVVVEALRRRENETLYAPKVMRIER